MATDKPAEGLMQTLGFLYVKRQRGITLCQRFALGM